MNCTIASSDRNRLQARSKFTNPLSIIPYHPFPTKGWFGAFDDTNPHENSVQFCWEFFPVYIGVHCKISVSLKSRSRYFFCGALLILSLTIGCLSHHQSPLNFMTSFQVRHSAITTCKKPMVGNIVLSIKTAIY